MTAKPRFPSLRHFHIRWSGRLTLDWESFKTHSEAQATAMRLAHPHESYRIEEHDHACERCATFWREKLGNMSNAVTIFDEDQRQVRGPSLQTQMLRPADSCLP